MLSSWFLEKLGMRVSVDAFYHRLNSPPKRCNLKSIKRHNKLINCDKQNHGIEFRDHGYGLNSPKNYFYSLKRAGLILMTHSHLKDQVSEC